MDRFWWEATFVLDTLMRKAHNQDPDGMDLFFTSGSIKVEGHEGRMKILRAFKDDRFSEAMKNPQARPTKGNHTNPRTKMSEILNSYFGRCRKAKENRRPTKKNQEDDSYCAD
jgi:hypothetical protein